MAHDEGTVPIKADSMTESPTSSDSKTSATATSWVRGTRGPLPARPCDDDLKTLGSGEPSHWIDSHW